MRYTYGLTCWDVLLMLDRMNAALRVYRQASDEDVKRKMDVLFANCYDYLVNRGVPIYFDEKPGLWLLRLH